MITARCPGRICLLGDNADLIEKPAIAAAISAYLTVTMQKRNDDLVVLEGPDIGAREQFGLEDTLTFDSPLRYMKAVFARMKDRIDRGFDARVTSEIPIAAGLSSSAALIIATIRALGEGYGMKMNAAETAELAFRIESRDLAVECGRMDQYAIAFGGVTYIDTSADAGVERLPSDSIPFVVADTQEQHDTTELQVWLRKRIAAGEDLLLGSLGRVVDLVERGRDVIARGEPAELGRLMDRQQVEEKLMGTSTDKLEAFCRLARDSGALGAKQMGAGGGGCVIALCPAGEVQAIRGAFEQQGAPAWAFEIVEA